MRVLHHWHSLYIKPNFLLPLLPAKVVKQFPVVAVMCYPQIQWLKKNTNVLFYSLGGQKSEITPTGLMARGQQGWFLLGTLRWGPASIPFQLPMGCIFLLAATVTSQTNNFDLPASLTKGHLSLHWTHPNNLGQSPHLKLFNNVCFTIEDNSCSED